MYRKQRLQTLLAIQRQVSPSTGDKTDWGGVGVVLDVGSSAAGRVVKSGDFIAQKELKFKGNVSMVHFKDVGELASDQNLQLLGVYLHKSSGVKGSRLTTQEVTEFQRVKSNFGTQQLRSELVSIVSAAGGVCLCI